MRVFVPGGSGYIGAHLVPFLLADGHEVTVMDTMWFGKGHLPDNPNCHAVKGDVRDLASFQDLCSGHDAVIWLAGLTNNDQCRKTPDLATAVNLTAFEPCVQVARDCGVGLFIFASSVAAYGSSEFILSETDPLHPETPYSEAKARCEEILAKYQSEDFTTVVTRSASVCGPSMNLRHDITVNRMVHDGRHGTITVNGGTQSRCHVHIDDLVDFYRLLLKTPEEKIAGQAWNVVAVSEHVIETAMRVARSLKHEPKIEVSLASDARSYAVSGEKAREELGFFPSRSIEKAVIYLEARTWPDGKQNWRML